MNYALHSKRKLTNRKKKRKEKINCDTETKRMIYIKKKEEKKKLLYDM